MPEVVVSASVAAPWGPIRFAATPRGVTAVDQLTPADAFAERLQRRFGSLPVDRLEAREPERAAAGAEAGRAAGAEVGRAAGQAAGHARAAQAALGRFVEGDLEALDGVPVDLADRPAWDQLVLGAVRGIRPGKTAGYGEVARMIGRPGAARAVGAAVGRSPIGLVIPCHRVIAGDGTLGGYGGGWWGGRAEGLELKRLLLAREGVDLPVPIAER